MTVTTADRILVTEVRKPVVNMAIALPKIAGLSGRSVGSLCIDILMAMRDRRKLTWQEYVVQGAWLDTDGQKSFVGSQSNKAVNDSLMAADHQGHESLLRDKFLTGEVLQANGFPVPELRGVFASQRSFGRRPTLRTATALAEWLSDRANLPVFAKPVDGSMALGSLPLQAGEQGQVRAGSRLVEVQALASEAARHFGQGWLLQEQLRQPADVETLIGPGIGTVRIVTLWEAEGPALLYAVWRHPAVGTWVDAAIFGKPNVGCGLDSETGEVVSAHLGDLFSGHPVTASLVTPERSLIGFRLPDWDTVVSMCCDGHRLFAGHALLGWDIALTERGPVISEVNTNPLHMSYQRSFKRGFLHPEHVRRLDVARRLMQDRVRSVSPG